MLLVKIEQRSLFKKTLILNLTIADLKNLNVVIKKDNQMNQNQTTNYIMFCLL